jgi:hypothetical protein
MKLFTTLALLLLPVVAYPGWFAEKKEDLSALVATYNTSPDSKSSILYVACHADMPISIALEHAEYRRTRIRDFAWISTDQTVKAKKLYSHSNSVDELFLANTYSVSPLIRMFRSGHVVTFSLPTTGSNEAHVSFSLIGFAAAFKKNCSWHPDYRLLYSRNLSN